MEECVGNRVNFPTPYTFIEHYIIGLSDFSPAKLEWVRLSHLLKPNINVFHEALFALRLGKFANTSSTWVSVKPTCVNIPPACVAPVCSTSFVVCNGLDIALNMEANVPLRLHGHP